MTGPAVRLPLPGGDLRYWPHIELGAAADMILSRLTRETDWRQDEVIILGRTHLQPRLHAWIGDRECVYSYSGLTQRPGPWTPLLADLRDRIGRLTGARFNSVLLNLYRDGADSMGEHADDEPELGPEPVIASLSLGAERPLVFRHRRDREIAPVRIPLGNASLLVMAGTTQANWKHGIARTRRPVGPRLNLTFRLIRMAG